MRIQSGIVDADSQSQVKRLIMSGAEASEIAESLVIGYVALQNTNQANVALTWWEGMNVRTNDAKLHRGVLKRLRGELDQAKNTYESVILECPHHELAHLHLADLLLETDTPRNALQHYLTVLHQAPRSVTASVGAARCLRRLGMWSAAEQHLKDLLNRPDPAVEVIQESGEIALEQGNYELAETHLTAAVSSHPSTHELRVAVATTFALQGRPSQGIPYLQQDAQIESLRKQQGDLQAASLLEPDSAAVRRQLQDVANELMAIEN